MLELRGDRDKDTRVQELSKGHWMSRLESTFCNGGCPVYLPLCAFDSQEDQALIMPLGYQVA